MSGMWRLVLNKRLWHCRLSKKGAVHCIPRDTLEDPISL